MTLERDDALDGLFLAPSGRARTAGDVPQLLGSLFAALEAALLAGSELGDEWGTTTREESDREIRTAAIVLGEQAVDGMRGLVISRSVDESTLAPRPGDRIFSPLDDAWQRQPDQYEAAAEIVRGQGARVQELSGQPNLMFRRLAAVVAFAADLAGWTAWVDL